MLKKELTFDVGKVLKGLIDEFSSELVQKVRRILEPRDLRLFDYVFRTIYQSERLKGRYYDKLHIPLDALFSVRAVRCGQAPPLTVPAGILHDIGYAFLDPDLRVGGEKKENLSVVSFSRVMHMQKVVKPALEILFESGDYTTNEMCDILDVDVRHDNGYLGFPIDEEPLLLSVRDADRTLVMHLISFWKDWLNVASAREDFSPLDLFRSRLIAFYNVNDPAPVSWGKPEKLTEEDKFHTHRVPYTPLAKKWRDRQFEARWEEIHSDILKDENSFRRYAEEHIRAEIAAGRG